MSYEGDPSIASVEVGRAFRELLARDCLDVVEAVPSGRTAAADVRSPASDHAVIQRGFLVKAGLAAAGVCAVAAWA